MSFFFKKDYLGSDQGRNHLLDLFEEDPMARREFLDNHERMPLWAKAVFHVRLWWDDLLR